MTLNPESKEVIAKGYKQYRFDGTIKANNTAEMKIFRFKLGEDAAYLE